MTVKFRDTEFQIKDYSYAVINAFAPALKKLKTLEREYLKDIDTIEYDKACKRLDDLRKSIATSEGIPEKKTYHEGQKKKLEDAINELSVKFKDVIDDINVSKNLAQAEWMTDIDIQKPAIEKILIGDKSKIDWETDDAGILIQDCCKFFFQVFTNSKLK